MSELSDELVEALEEAGFDDFSIMLAEHCDVAVFADETGGVVIADEDEWS